MPTFLTAECRGFFNHWQSLPKDGLAPTSETFLDFPQPLYAPYVYILEYAGNDLIIRLIGTALVERWKQNRTGQSFNIHQDPQVREMFFLNSLNVVHLPCALRAVNRFRLASGQNVSTEAIILPLTIGADRPLRLVTYSHLFEEPNEKDELGGWEDVLDHEWIDLGAGVPEDFAQSSQ